MDIDRPALADFLRRRRAALQPEDVGLTRGPRRRTEGLRREEVAALCHMSTDFYARIERERGPQPSPQMIASIAQGLHLTVDERDHLFRLAGHAPPARGAASEHVSPGLLRVLDRLDDTPAEIVSELGETLRQTRLGRALTGDTTRYSGHERSSGWRWFTDPASRSLYRPEDHDFQSRLFAAGLRQIVGMRGPDSRAARLAEALLERSAEFRDVWSAHEVGLHPRELKHFVHGEVGELEVTCQRLFDPVQSHWLLVYTAIPGSESHERLQLLGMLSAAPGAAAR